MRDASARKVQGVVAAFEDAVRKDSEAVICRPAEEVFRIVNSPNELYSTFYKLVEAGVRVPQSNWWDENRGVADAKLFPNYHRNISFALLSLDQRGVEYYGNCHMILRTAMISHRTTVFEENAIEFMRTRNIQIDGVVPSGHRAVWNERGKLAVAKLANNFSVSTSINDFSKILLNNGKGRGHEQFIEAHIYGPISLKALKSVGVSKTKRRGLAIKVEALKAKLKALGINYLEY